MSIIEMNVPELAESITEVTLAEWLVEDGDVVRMDQPICEMETDKASQELFAEQAGRITLKAEAGDDLSIGALICTIDTSVAPEEDAPSAPAVDSASTETSDEEPVKEEGIDGVRTHGRDPRDDRARIGRIHHGGDARSAARRRRGDRGHGPTGL